jgi:hypothetical protein
MNATRVSKCAGRRLGIIFTTIILFVLAIGQMEGAEVVVTVTGDIVGGSGDYLHLFGKVLNLAGTPFTLVFTFDDTKGKPIPLAGCKGTASGVKGVGADSPGIAVLTIAGKSFTFGTRKSSESETWREISSECSSSKIGFEVDDGVNSRTVININIHPADNRKSFTQNSDWRSAVTSTAMATDSLSGFSIEGPGMSGDGGIFYVKSITISGPKKVGSSSR